MSHVRTAAEAGIINEMFALLRYTVLDEELADVRRSLGSYFKRVVRACLVDGVDVLRPYRIMGGGDLNSAVNAYNTLWSAGWALSRGIYAIDPTVHVALCETGYSGILHPGMVRLPQPVVWIIEPSWEVAEEGEVVPSRWALIRETLLGRCVTLSESGGLQWLCMRYTALKSLDHMDTDQIVDIKILDFAIPLDGSRIDDAIRAGIEEMGPLVNLRRDSPDLFEKRGWFSRIKADINLLFYLCTDSAEYSPARPKMTYRIKGKARPPEKTRTWDIGIKTGKLLREASEGLAKITGPNGSRTAKRPHVRRAHWHLYWTGKGRKTPKLNWVSPMLVGTKDPGQLISTKYE
jgi:hypothetical protein